MIPSARPRSSGSARVHGGDVTALHQADARVAGGGDAVVLAGLDQRTMSSGARRPSCSPGIPSARLELVVELRVTGHCDHVDLCPPRSWISSSVGRAPRSASRAPLVVSAAAAGRDDAQRADPDQTRPFTPSRLTLLFIRFLLPFARLPTVLRPPRDAHCGPSHFEHLAEPSISGYRGEHRRRHRGRRDVAGHRARRSARRARRRLDVVSPAAGSCSSSSMWIFSGRTVVAARRAR